MQVKLDEAVAALATAREELAQGQEDVQTQKVAVGQMAADIYEMGDPRMLSFANILDAQDPGEMTRSESVTDAVVGPGERHPRRPHRRQGAAQRP